MKKIFLILLLSSLLFKSFAQYHKDKINEPVKVILLYSGSILLNAIGDG